MSHAATKAQRLLQIEALLLAHPEGLTQAEIARRLGVHRSTVSRYLADLPRHIYVDDLDGNRWKIDRSAYLVQVRFSLHEAVAIHLAARLLATRTDKHNPHAASALRKLGVALARLAPQVSRHLQLSADVMDAATQRLDPGYLQVLEQLSLAWAEGRKVRVWHRHEKTRRVYEYVFAPYFIEAYAVGQTAHVIGWREPPGALRTFKLERIERVELLREQYTIPEDFDPRELLAEAWGIWYTDEPPVEVVLRFHPRVAHRVKETRWHRSEKVEEQPDGSLIWRAWIAEPQEMVPWIRGWGADVEVLAPARLRAILRDEAHRLAAVYSPTSTNAPPWLHLWAKLTPGTSTAHPLLYHMIDVGQCARMLWNHGVSPSLRDRLSRAVGLDQQACGNLLSFWAALHDLGKAGPAFQAKSPVHFDMLSAEGFDFPPSHGGTPAPHGLVSAWALKELLEKETGLAPRDARRVAHVLGGHHGIWPNLLAVSSVKQHDRGGPAWAEARLALVRAIKDVFNPPELAALPRDPESRGALLAVLSGLTTAADWLGSMDEVFRHESRHLPSSEYVPISAQRAEEALRRTGWMQGWRPEGKRASFEEIFPFSPNEVQSAVIQEAVEVEQPALVILEAPTGTGKTEAALYLADVWLQRNRGRGLYIAMPTQATSNQMHMRVARFLSERYPEQNPNLHLVHGQALWDDIARQLRLAAIGEEREDRVRAEEWFLPRKRTLLAPLAVGTIDQALMGVLQTRHFFLRLFGLSHKVVIFDEVHAYDTYMEHLFLRLLAWLRALGTSVIILSATLPEATRRSIVQAYTGDLAASLPATTYPRLTIASMDGVQSIPLSRGSDRDVELSWCDASPVAIVESLTTLLADGGCAAVVCNTVRTAQELYEALISGGIPEHECVLFHARMPAVWRRAVEERVLSRFGRDGQRPERAVVVATQVVEQSLDLDFDVMISELAPIDLLIQRAGRLHRHPERVRPPRLRLPRLILLRPSGTVEEPEFGASAYVYQPYILWQTWRALDGRSRLHLPSDTASLIEYVYGGFQEEGLSPGMAARLRGAYREMQREFQDAAMAALQRLVPPPWDDGLVTKTWQDLHDEENPAVHPQLRALTRLSEPGVTLICLHRLHDGSLNVEPDGSGVSVDLEQPPDRDLIRSLVSYAVTVRDRGAVKYFAKRLPWRAWRETMSLRYAYPVVFEDGACTLEGTNLRLILDRSLGLRIERGGAS